MRVFWATVLVLWAWQGFAASELSFEGEKTSIDQCGRTETFQPILLLETGLAKKWNEDTPQEDRLNHVLAYMMVPEDRDGFPYTFTMFVREGDVYTSRMSRDDGNKQIEHVKIGRVSKDDASNLQLSADFFGGDITLQISITDIASDDATATIKGKATSPDCVSTWENKIKVKERRSN